MEFSLASMGPRPECPEVDIDPELVEALQTAGMDRQVRILRVGAKENAAYLDDLRAKVKGIKGFWAAVLVGWRRQVADGRSTRGSSTSCCPRRRTATR